jgi:hypothetical protein
MQLIRDCDMLFANVIIIVVGNEAVEMCRVRVDWRRSLGGND